MTTETGIWHRITRSLKSKLSKEEFNTWFSQTSLHKLENNLAIINVPNKFVANWLKENYLKEIKSGNQTFRYWYYNKPSVCIDIETRQVFIINDME